MEDSLFSMKSLHDVSTVPLKALDSVRRDPQMSLRDLHLCLFSDDLVRRKSRLTKSSLASVFLVEIAAVFGLVVVVVCEMRPLIWGRAVETTRLFVGIVSNKVLVLY